MAALRNGVFKIFLYRDRNILTGLIGNRCFSLSNVRHNFMFRANAQTPEHNEKEYEYEISKDAEEWKFVERLMPYETVPEPTVKPNYPSGWRPATASPRDHPYFVERSRNHMLSVYLHNFDRGQLKVTSVKRVRGQIFLLHDELKNYIETAVQRKVASYVEENNAKVCFRGDYVYYAEQWCLSKGF